MCEYHEGVDVNTKEILNLLQLPIEIFYRIFDYLDQSTILISLCNVCQRLNAIRETYHRYQVFVFSYEIQFSMII